MCGRLPSGSIQPMIDLPKADPRMLLAERIIDQQRGDFDPPLFVDRYEHALRGVIQRKREGMPVPVAADEVPETNVVNLMDALRRSRATRAARACRSDHRPQTGRSPRNQKRGLESRWRDGHPASIPCALGSA
jgi:non-homologous end joining protein Ku